MHRTQRSASPQTTKSDITQDDDGTGHAITVNYFIVNVIVAKLETKIKITQDLNAITGAADSLRGGSCLEVGNEISPVLLLLQSSKHHLGT